MEINDSSEPPAKKDAFFSIPIILAITLLLLDILLSYIGTPNLDSYISIIHVSALLIAVPILLVGISDMRDGHYKSGLSLILTVPFLFLLLGAGTAADYIKFTLHEKQYLEEIQSLKPDSKGFRYTKFLLSGSWGEGTQLVYDESDEIAVLHPEGFAQCPYTVTKLKQHFYVVLITCG